ncbi:MAG: cytochrome c oxidase assembly protein [Cellulomonas sp.]
MPGLLPPLTPATLMTSWVLDPLGASLAAVLAVVYSVGLVRSRRRGVRWPWLRSVAFLVMGVGSLVLATCGWIGAYRSSLFWVGAVQATVLSAVTPVGLALGDPVALAETTWGEARAQHLRSTLRGPVARVLMFPLVSSMLAIGSLILVFFTGYFVASTTSTLVRALLEAQMLVTGSLFVLPLLGADMLPAWCTPPVRAVIAFADGLLDALPGIFVMTAPRLLARGAVGLTTRSWGPSPELDQKLGGGAMLLVAEVVGLPVLAAVIAAWVRSDEADAREVDAALDALAPQTAEPELTRPWWEVDPRFADRRE